MFISFVRTIILYFTIILAVRVMGKRQINQLQTSELVVTLLISDLAVIPMQDSGQPLFSGLIPILVLIVEVQLGIDPLAGLYESLGLKSPSDAIDADTLRRIALPR